MALGFTLKKGHLSGTNDKTEIAVAAAAVLFFCIAALHHFTDTVLFGNSFTESQNGRGWKGPLWVI